MTLHGSLYHQRPYWRGIWEAAMKSAKKYVFSVVGNTKRTYEEFSTILVSMERILNSRPITALSDDPEDLPCHTLGHFLIGSSFTAFPDRDLTNESENRLASWQKCVKMHQSFWRRWSVALLNRL